MSESFPKFNLSRRSFLKSSALAGFAGLFPIGCQQSVEKALPEPYSVFREVQKALRASPDHAPGRAAKLVAQGEPGSDLSFRS